MRGGTHWQSEWESPRVSMVTPHCPIGLWFSMRRLVRVNRVLLWKADEGFRSSLSVFWSFCSLHTGMKVFPLIPWSRSLCSVLSPVADFLRWCGAG